MADRLIFPISFDLTKGADEADKEAQKVLRRLQATLDDKPLRSKIVVEKGEFDAYEKGFNKTITSIKDKMKDLEDIWNNMPNNLKFKGDLSSGEKELSDAAKKIVRDYLQLTEALRTYGETLQDVSRNQKKSIDEQIKAEEKAVQEAIKAEQKKVDEFLKTEAQITRDHFAQIEARKKAEVAAMREMEQRYAEKQRMYEKLFSKVSIPAGIDVGYTQGASNTAISNALGKYNALRKELDEIDRKFARIQATGAAFDKAGAPTARVIPMLERRAQLEQEIANTTRTAEEAQREYAKRQADAAKAEEKAIADKQAADAAWVKSFIANQERAAQAHAKRIQQIQAEIAAQAKLKAEMQAMYNELFTRAGQKGINVGFIDTSKVERDTAYVRERYRTLLNDLNILAQTRYNVKISIDKQFEPEIQRITKEINNLGRQIIKVGSKGGDVKPFLAAIQQLRDEIDKINQKKIDIFNNKAISTEYQALRTQVSELYNAMVEGQRKVGADKSANEALGRQIEKVEQLRAKIAELDAQYARLNAQGGAMTAAGRATPEALKILNERKKLEEDLARTVTTAEEAQRQAAERTAKARELWAQRAAAAEKRLADEQLRIQDKIAAKQQAKAAKQANEIRQIQQRIASLKQERAALVAKENTLANINAKLAAYNAQLQRAEIGSKTFERITKEIERLSQKLDKINGKTIKPKGVEETTRQFREQATYVERLIKRMAVYASFSMVGGFLSKIREITAQFELQRVSLGAIIRDQTRANQLFSEIKQFALKSPITIMDLTKYTKQVAAYRIETDKLFDTTKRLADVSVGLGVDMQRLVLAYGQVKAATYLRASELRQFTEAGIPMLELLAEKFSKVEGEMVTTADVMKRITKRGVEFKDVEQIFIDMTSAGGMFYNMQEKQGKTLYGMWAKLGDAASIMYDEIGNTAYVSSSMKGVIKLLTDMMRNWRSVARVVGIAAAVGAALAVYRMSLKLVTVETAKLDLATKQYNASMDIANKRMASSNILVRLSGKLMATLAGSTYGAATATTVLARAFNVAKAALIQTGIGALIVALGYLIDKLFLAKSATEELADSLKDVQKENFAEQRKSTLDFERLANMAVNAADGSRQQREALDELQRSYGDIIPSEQLSIENLRKMKGNYDSLTASVREYIQMRMRQKGVDEIVDKFTPKIMEAEDKIRDILSRGKTVDMWGMIGETDLKFSDSTIAAFLAEFRNEVIKTSGDVDKAMRNAFKNIGVELTERQLNALSESFAGISDNTIFAIKWSDSWGDSLNQLTDNIIEQEKAIADWNNTMDASNNRLGVYKEQWESIAETVKNAKYIFTSGDKTLGAVDNNDNTFLYQQMQKNLEIKKMADTLKKDLGAAWDDSMAVIVEKINERKPEIISALDFSAIYAAAQASGNSALIKFVEKLQTRYQELVPKSEVVRMMNARFGEIVRGFKLFVKDYGNLMMQGDEDVDAYVKRLQDRQEELRKQLEYQKSLLKVAAKFKAFTNNIFGNVYANMESAVAKMQDELKVIDATLDGIATPKTKSGSKSSGSRGRNQDPRLQALKEEMSMVQELYNEYDKLQKQIGDTAAQSKMREIYANTMKLLSEKFGKYGFEFEMPFDTKTLKSDLEILLNQMRKLQGLKDKGGKELFPKIGIDIDKAVKDIEEVDFTALRQAMERKLKELSEQLARTRTAKEFFDKILAQTGDVDIAARISLSVYGSTGDELFKQTVEQIREVFKSENVNVGIGVESAIDFTNQVVNYEKLAKVYEQYQNDLVEANRKSAEEIVKNGQKAEAEEILAWYKKYEKAKSYEEQITDVISRETEARIKIIKSGLPQTEKDSLLQASYTRQSQDVSGLNFKEFKESDDYIKIFEDLDNISTPALRRLRAEMQGIIDTDKNLSPENMKALVKSMSDIDSQLEGRGFGGAIVNSIKEYMESVKQLKIAKQELSAAKAEYEAQEPQLDADIRTAQGEEIAAEMELNYLRQSGLATESQITAAMIRQQQAQKATELAMQRKSKAATKVQKAEKKVTDEQDKQKKAVNKFQSGLGQVSDAANTLANGLKSIKDLLDISSDSAEGLVFDSAIDGLEKTAQLMQVLIVLQEMYNIITSSNPWIAIIAAVLAVAMILGSYIANNKVRKANNEIAKQQELIDALSYSYDRLNDKVDEAFGSDYISNYNKRIKSLEGQIVATQKQLEAERSKGKKKSSDAINDYEEKIRDLRDEIQDMQDEVAARMLGTELADAARDFADAWLEAYKEFGSTTDAIKDKFKEMMQSLIVESVMAEVMKQALRPVYDLIDNMGSSDFYNRSFWEQVVSEMDKATDDMNAGATAISQLMEQAGISLEASSSDLTGISRDISTASEESINGLAAGINTQNFYIAQIHANVQGIYALMQGGSVSQPQVQDLTLTDLVTIQNQHLAQLPSIAQHTADTVARMDEMVSLLGKVITPKSASSQFAVQVNI